MRSARDKTETSFSEKYRAHDVADLPRSLRRRVAPSVQSHTQLKNISLRVDPPRAARSSRKIRLAPKTKAAIFVTILSDRTKIARKTRFLLIASNVLRQSTLYSSRCATTGVSIAPTPPRRCFGAWKITEKRRAFLRPNNIDVILHNEFNVRNKKI